MASSRLNVVLVGGGSNAWVPRVVKDMILTDGLRDARYVLLDINKKASDLTKAFLDKLAAGIGAKATFESTDRQAAALKGADYVVITISTGGLKAMGQDLAIPEEYGIYHTVGDTCGPGGWARCMRNFHVFARLAEDLNRYAPGAVVLNYTNPMTTLTDVLARICKGPVIGLCHGLFENLRFYTSLYKLKSEEEISIKYAGLNHFFWITEARARGRDIVADLGRRLERRSFTDLLRELHKDPMGFRSHREVATELFRQTGVLPYLGDRHTCEWFSHYITSKKTMRKYKIERTSIAQRQASFDARAKNLRKMIRGTIPEDYFRRSRETAADIIAAHSQGRDFIDVGNVPNIGQVSNLPMGAVLETAVRVDSNGFTPLTFGPLPRMVRSMVEPYAVLFPMCVDACFKGDRTMALQALRMDPVCAHLTGDQVEELGLRLLKAHKRFIPMFTG